MQLNKHKTILDVVTVNRLGFVQLIDLNNLMRIPTKPFHRGTMLTFSTETTFT